MRRDPEKLQPSRAQTRGRATSDEDPLPAVLRSAHIFAAVMREDLEGQLLAEISPVQLTLSQLHLLKLMSLDGGHPMHELAELIGISPSAATKNVDKLEGLGLVARSHAAGDRRTTLITISAQGTKLVRRFEKRERQRMGPLLERFGGDELMEVSRLLERLSVALLEEDCAADRACLRCAAHMESDCAVGRLRGGCPYEAVREAHARGHSEQGSGGVERSRPGRAASGETPEPGSMS